MLAHAGLGIAPTVIDTPPWGIVQDLATGQSLSVGQQQAPVSLVQHHANVKLGDTASAWNIASPGASTLYLAPLVAPQRTITTITGYPNNIAGESMEIETANATVDLHAGGAWRMAASSTGRSGFGLAGIQKGGSDVAYAAGIYEVGALARLAIAAGKTFGVRGVPMEHGEQDAVTLNPNYQPGIVTLQANYATDIVATLAALGITQTRPIPLFVSFQHSGPQNFCSKLGPGGGITSPAMLAAALASVSGPKSALIVAVGSKYQYPYFDGIHLIDYRPHGDKVAQAMRVTDDYIAGKGPPWLPLYPLTWTRVGNVVTGTYHVPYGKLVLDPTIAPPHQAGPWSPYWSGAMGFEYYSSPINVISASSTSPIVLGFDVPHGLTTGSPLAVSGVDPAIIGGSNTHANGVWPSVTVVDATHVSLDGSTFNGTFATHGNAAVPIKINSVATRGNQVIITLAQAVAGCVGYADQSDAAYGVSAASAQFLGRVGCLRDSDPMRTIASPHAPLYNFAAPGAWPVA